MRRLILASLLASVAALGTAGIAAADHAHDLVTPGTTVHDIGAGQTQKCATDPGGHQFHVNVHTGVPGTFAFAQGGQVTVMKTENATC
jgi:hypothetical protein